MQVESNPHAFAEAPSHAISPGPHVGDAVVGAAVVGEEAGDASVGDAEVGNAVVGDAEVGAAVVGDALVGALVGGAVNGGKNLFTTSPAAWPNWRPVPSPTKSELAWSRRSAPPIQDGLMVSAAAASTTSSCVPPSLMTRRAPGAT